MNHDCTLVDIDFYIPSKKLTNQELSDRFSDWSPEKIKEKTGIEERGIAASDETAADLAIKAAQKILHRHDVSQIDYLLFCTQSPDYKLPASACIIQDRLGLATNVGAIDINQGCSGYIYGLSLAKGLIVGNIATQVLLLTGETYSKYLEPSDQSVRTIFGDGGSATLLQPSNHESIGNFNFGTDGKFYDKLIVESGGARKPFTDYCHAKNLDKSIDCYLRMNGPDIFNFTIRTVPPMIKQCLQKNNLTNEDIDLFVFHQANKFILEYLKKLLKIPSERFYINLEKYGNTVSSTIPIALKNAIIEKRLQPGNRVLLCGFGVGLSWGAITIQINSDLINNINNITQTNL